MDYKVLSTILCDRGRAEKSSVGDLTKLKINTIREKGDWYVWADVGVSNKWRLDKLLEGSHDIHSVWRISDNVTFKLGDMINTHGTIKRLRKVPSGSKGIMYQFSCYDKNGWIDLDTIPKNWHKDHQEKQSYDFEMINFKQIGYVGKDNHCYDTFVIEPKLPKFPPRYYYDKYIRQEANLGEALMVINSVRRFDDVIFKLGDTIRHNGTDRFNKSVISAFKIAQGSHFSGKEICEVEYETLEGQKFVSRLDQVEIQPATESYRMKIMDMSKCPSKHAEELREYQRKYNSAMIEMNKHMEAEMDRIEAEFWFGKSNKLLLLL